MAFATLTGTISLGLFCPIVKTFAFEPSSSFIKEIDRFFQKEFDKIVEFGDSFAGNFGIGGTVEAFCTALCYFPETLTNCRRHLILLPVSCGTEILPNFRTCPDDLYTAAPLHNLLSLLRGRKVSLSLVAPGLSDSTVVEQFLVFKCNEKIGGGTGKFTEALGVDWIVRFSAGLTGEEAAIEPPGINATGNFSRKTMLPTQTSNQLDDNELLNQTLLKLSTMPPEERVVALKALLDPATSTFSSSFRQKFAATIKSRLQLQDQPAIRPSPMPPASQQRRASQDSSTTFWSGCIRFFEKQQSFAFRVQFVAVDSQSQLPRVSLENWPHELNLTGLLDSKKDSIQAGLSVGYAFRVNVANADTPIASYLMGRMCQIPKASPSHLACFRISQDVLIMLRVLNHEDIQFVGYLIDRRFPKSNLTPAAQAASNAINSLTALKAPLSTTLSTGMESMAIASTGRRPSFDIKQRHAPTIKPIATNYLSYTQFIQQQQLQQQSPVKIAAISGSTVTTNQLLTDPQAILQKLRPVVSRSYVSPGLDSTQPSIQPNEQQNSVAMTEDQEQLDQSFVDAWLN